MTFKELRLVALTPQISFADSSNSQSVIPEYIHPRNIQGLDKGDCHSFLIESM
jgi:hypothetical protein